MEAVLPRFTGPISQVPPAYSALKVDGERAYDRARAGEDVVLASRDVVIHRLVSPLFGPVRSECGLPPRQPGDFDDAVQLMIERRRAEHAGIHERIYEATLTAHVSKGTYIRSLARDIAQALGTVGHVTKLRRTKAGPFTIDSAISLDKLREAAKARNLEQILLPLRAGLDDIPALSLDPDQAGSLRQGRVLTGIAADDGRYFACAGDVPVALVEVMDRQVRVVRGFNL